MNADDEAEETLGKITKVSSTKHFQNKIWNWELDNKHFSTSSNTRSVTTAETREPIALHLFVESAIKSEICRLEPKRQQNDVEQQREKVCF